LWCQKDVQNNGKWHVYYASPNGADKELNVITKVKISGGGGFKIKSVTKTIKVLSFTELAFKYGFVPIPAYKNFRNGKLSAVYSEWWHFQYTRHLRNNFSTLGDEFVQVYKEEVLANGLGTTWLWYKNLVWSGDVRGWKKGRRAVT